MCQPGALAHALLEVSTHLATVKGQMGQRAVKRAAAHALYLRQQAVSEKELLKAVVPIIRAQVKSATAQVRAGNRPKLNRDEWRDAIINAAFAPLARAASRGAIAQLKALGLAQRRAGRRGWAVMAAKASTATEWLADHDIAPPPGIATELPQWVKDKIEELLGESFDQDFWTKISDTTLQDVETILNNGLQSGTGMADLADAIDERLGTEAYYEGRALNIARTESANALNGANKEVIEGVKDELDGQVPMRSEWLSILSQTTRDTHAMLDGVPADEDGLWDLAGYMVPWPGHFSLPPGERCNCQCSVVAAFGMDDDAAMQEISDYSARVDDWEQERASRRRWQKRVMRIRAKGFCPTGPGGGVDNSCGGSGSGGTAGDDFIPAATREEAESYAKSNFVSWGDVSYRGVSVGMANQINKTLAGLFKATPGMPKFSNIKASKFKGRPHPDAPAAYGQGTTLLINTAILGDDKKFKAYSERSDAAEKLIRERVAAGTIPEKHMATATRLLSFDRQAVDDSVHGIITHEFGHHVDGYLFATKELIAERRTIIDRRADNVLKLSARADADANEYIAEAFVAHKRGETIDIGLSALFKRVGV